MKVSKMHPYCSHSRWKTCEMGLKTISRTDNFTEAAAGVVTPVGCENYSALHSQRLMVER